ncbi:MAG TPA: hypothetical protein VGO59_14795 [Verrucomicrobiae bacterium]|jgi:hypothetical protein
MHPEKEKFLNLKAVPARLTVEEAAWYLGFAAHDIPVLVANGFLKPLGHPGDNAVKFFALASLEPLRSDVKWLSRATDAMLDHWRKKNARKTEVESSSPVLA